jgi:hypothetical protein
METIKKLMCVLTFAALGIVSDANAQEMPPEQALAVRQAVVAWLECEECTEGQLEGVLKQGPLAVPSLAAALERGPSPASLEKVRRHLEQSHRNLVEYSRTHDEVKVELNEEEYVKLYLENYRANYGIRAAQALGKIGGDAARKSLEAASKLSLREDVKKVVAESAKGLGR